MLEVELEGEKVYSKPMNNIMGAKTLIGGLLQEPAFQQSPQLREVLTMINAVALQNQHEPQ